MFIAAFCQGLLERGCGLATDGRKDVNGRSNELSFLVTSFGHLLITTQEMVGYKRAEDLLDVWLESIAEISKISKGVFHLTVAKKPDPGPDFEPEVLPPTANALESGVGEYVTHCVSDSGGGALKARTQMQKKNHILSIPCVTHIMALLPKHLVAAGGVPYIKRNIDRFGEITKLFRSYALPKSLLESNGIVLRRLIDSRFMFVYSALLRFQESGANVNIATIMDTMEFLEWAESQKEDDERSLVASVRETVLLPEFRLFVLLFLQLVQPWVIAMREFDKAKNSIYIVHPLFCKLACLAVTTLQKVTFKDVPTPAKIGILRVVINFVKKFSNPIFTAA